MNYHKIRDSIINYFNLTLLLSCELSIRVFLDILVRKTWVESPQISLDKSDRLVEYAFMEPLPIQIPADYAALLGCDSSHISHCNVRRKGRQFTMAQTAVLVIAALTDPRIEGLTFYDLRQELIPFREHLQNPANPPKKKGRKRAR